MRLRLALLAVAALAATSARSATDETAPVPGVSVGQVAGAIQPLEPRPRLALVLSGGGARGAAHIGVLAVLEELHVVPDLIVGTSMGSIVGGLYAAGWAPDELQKLLEDIEWKGVFSDRLLRSERSFRRKQDTAVPLITARLRFDGLRPYLPTGLLGGQRLGLLLQSLELESTGVSDFDHLPVPYRAVAADILSGEAVIIGGGSLATAMRASMSIAGAFAPVGLEGWQLVDGGAVANIPIGIAQQLGAEHVIAIDITSPSNAPAERESFVEVISRLSDLLTLGNRELDLQRLRPGDVYVRPELGDITFADFARAADAVAIGTAAARAQADELRRFAASDEDWARFQERHHRRADEELFIDEVRIDNTSAVADELVARGSPVVAGSSFDASALRRDVMQLYGLEYFDPIDVGIDRAEGRGTLTLHTPRRPNRAYVQFGLTLYSDAQTDAPWTLTARHVVLAVNRRGGEWINVVQVGESRVLGSEFYQPLDYGMRWFVHPRIEWRTESQPLWDAGEQVAEYEIGQRGGRLDVGRVLGQWGELRVGAFYRDVDVRQVIGQQLFPDFEQQEPGGSIRFRVDTLDSTTFPRHGTEAVVEYQKSRADDTGAHLDRVTASWSKALSTKRNTLRIDLDTAYNLEEPASVLDLYELGGVFRLSGLGRDELLGSKGGLGKLMFYRRLTTLDLGALSSNLYVGASGEVGNVYFEDDPVVWSSLRFGGSVFVGAETPLGPALLAYGWTEPGRSRLHLLIGQRF